MIDYNEPEEELTPDLQYYQITHGTNYTVAVQDLATGEWIYRRTTTDPELAQGFTQDAKMVAERYLSDVREVVWSK